MSKLHIEPLEGRDFRRLNNGSLVVARNREFLAPCQDEPAIDFLRAVDHSLHLSKKQYEKRLSEEQAEFKHLYYDKLIGSRRFVIVEANGRDTAGKTGLRRRVEEAIGSDCKNFMPVGFAEPGQEELAHFWLWKYGCGERLPKYGQMRFFERGPSERLLVERVKHLAAPAELDASYAELNAWQWLLVRQGGIYIKLWLDISKKEQWRRFEDRRRDNPQKLAKSDYAARADWSKYTRQINAMIQRISTPFAPMHIISGEDKRYCRVTALQIINERLRAELG